MAALYACVPIMNANAETMRLEPVLRRGAKIPDDWPAEVVKSLEETGGAAPLAQALAMIEASYEGTDMDRMAQLLVNDHGKDRGGELAGSLSYRWLAEIEVAVANGLAKSPIHENKPVDLEGGIKAKSPKTKAG